MRHRYERTGPLALEPRAFLELFFAPPERVNEAHGDVAVVAIRGPLDSRRGAWCDSYEEIVERIDAAIASSARAIVMRIDSPGGECAGMLEAARTIRARCAAAGKPLVAYVDGKACSAAYAIACAADRIVADETAIVGSIGVIAPRVDVTAANAAHGMKVALVTSGARKADGHPHAPITETELAEMQVIIDGLASTFFEHVAAMRGVDAASIAALEARTYVAGDAVRVGLVDEVSTFDSLLAKVASGEELARASSGETTMNEEEKARAALQAIIDDEESDEKAKARARKALAAMDDDGEEEKAEDETKDEAKAEGDDDEEKKEAATSAVSASTAGDLAAKVSEQGKMLADLRSKFEAQERTAFLATRPDLAPELVAVLEQKPVAEVKAIVNAIPKPKVPNRAAAATVQATRGDGQGDGSASRLPPEQKAALDRAMGLEATRNGVVERGNKLVLGASVPVTGKGA